MSLCFLRSGASEWPVATHERLLFKSSLNRVSGASQVCCPRRSIFNISTRIFFKNVSDSTQAEEKKKRCFDIRHHLALALKLVPARSPKHCSATRVSGRKGLSSSSSTNTCLTGWFPNCLLRETTPLGDACHCGKQAKVLSRVSGGEPVVISTADRRVRS